MLGNNNSNKKIVIFDVGRTLVNVTHKDIVHCLMRKKIVSKFFAMRVCFLFLYYKIFGIDQYIICDITRDFYKVFRGLDVLEVRKVLSMFFEQELKDKTYKQSINIINQHVEDGYEVILISALFPDIVNFIKDMLNLNFAIVPILEVKNGLYTGRVLGDIPYGTNKAEMVKDLIKREFFSLKESYVYADRFSDIPLFELADHPVVVNPELKLKLEAEKRNWRVINLTM